LAINMLFSQFCAVSHIHFLRFGTVSHIEVYLPPGAAARQGDGEAGPAATLAAGNARRPPAAFSQALLRIGVTAASRGSQ